MASWSDAADCTVRMMGRVLSMCIALAVLALACAPEPPATEPVPRGRQLYRSMSCGSCHEPNVFGQRLGPALDHIRRSIVDPGAYVVSGYNDSMPRDLGRDLSPTDLDALVAYLLSLK